MNGTYSLESLNKFSARGTNKNSNPTHDQKLGDQRYSPNNLPQFPNPDSLPTSVHGNLGMTDTRTLSNQNRSTINSRGGNQPFNMSQMQTTKSHALSYNLNNQHMNSQNTLYQSMGNHGGLQEPSIITGRDDDYFAPNFNAHET